MKRRAVRRHTYLSAAREGEWVWLEHGFPPPRTKTTHAGKAGVVPTVSRSGILEPPVVPTISQLASVAITPTPQFRERAPEQTANEFGMLSVPAKRSFSVPA
jgi:hypothetical protein